MRKEALPEKGSKQRSNFFWIRCFSIVLFVFSVLHIEAIKGANLGTETNSNSFDTPIVMCTPEQSGFWSISGGTATYDFGNGVIARLTTTTVDPFTSGTFNSSGTGFWSNAIEGDVSIQNNFTWGSTLTISFEDNFGNPVTVEDPILHLDRLGGIYGTLQNSAEVTLLGGLTWTSLGGTNDFLATTTTVRDSGAGTPVGPLPGLESSMNDDDGTAAGSLRINGVISSFTMQFVLSGVAGLGNDDIKFIMEVCTNPDSDNDGIADVSDICSGFEDDLDHDNDGIPDGCDLDDDNDGILDTAEGACTLMQSGDWTIAGTTATYVFGDGTIARLTTTNSEPFGTDTFNPLGTGFWSENLEGDASIKSEFFWDSILTITFEDASGNPVTVNNPILHFDRIGGVFGTHQNSAEITLLDGLTWTPLEGTSDFRTRANTVRDGGVGVVPPTPNLGESTEMDADGSASGSLRVHGNISQIRLQFVQSGVNAFGKDGIEIILSACNSLDTDGDGVPNYLDLDSDNDGIYDVEEAGHMQPHTNGVVDGTFGTDGIPDVTQATSGANSGVVDYTLADSETTPDGVPDYIDSDSDNDGCDDVTEAGYTDGDTNGYLGIGTFGVGLTVDGDGRVTSRSDGYTGTTVEVTTAGLAPVITTQPSDSIICENMDTAFEVVADNADTYQWQIFNGTTWENLTDTGIHSDTTTNTLTITDAALSDTGNQYRVLISNSEYLCATLISEVKVLTVNTPPTINVTQTPSCSVDLTTYSFEVTVSSGTVTSTVGTVTNTAGNVWEISGVASGTNADITVTVATSCDETITVSSPACSIEANDDTVNVDGNTGGTSINIVDANDTINGNGAILGTDVTMTVADPDTGDGVSLDPSTGEVTVLPNTPPGDYTLTYTLCSIGTPVICDDATVTITVSGEIVANDDTVSIDGDTGGTSLNIVDDNDTLNGNGVTLGTDVTMIVTDPDLTDGVSLDETTGEVTVLPGTPPGDYTFTYALCSVATPVVCDDATVTVTVTQVERVANMALSKTGTYVDANQDGLLNLGDEIHYSFTLENTGNLDITDITIDDPLPGIEVTGGPIDLAVGEIDTDTFTAIYELTEADLFTGSVSNQAIANGQDPDGNTVTDVSDDPSNDTNIDIDGDGDFEDVTVLSVEPSDEIEVFTGISPNGDGINDQFRIVGLQKFSNNILRIYNRWGIKVFEENGYEQQGARYFEGVSNGRATINSEKRLPVGTYYYILEYQNTRGVSKSKAGYLYINR